MSDQAVVMGSFRDVDLDRTADSLDGLRDLGIPEADITIMSSLPHSPSVLGRPHARTWLPWISLGSAVLGFLVGLFFTAITPYLYIIRVGGQPVVPTPPTLLLLYEFTMLFLIVGTFGGLLWLNHFPDTKPEYYDPELFNDRIGVLVQLPPDKVGSAMAVLESHGAFDVHQPERRDL
jgi:hypothetical protein